MRFIVYSSQNIQVIKNKMDEACGTFDGEER